jgi:hypothetical protein
MRRFVPPLLLFPVDAAGLLTAFAPTITSAAPIQDTSPPRGRVRHAPVPLLLDSVRILDGRTMRERRVSFTPNRDVEVTERTLERVKGQIKVPVAHVLREPLTVRGAEDRIFTVPLRDDRGKALPEGAYTIRITARTPHGETITAMRGFSLSPNP